MTAHFQHLLPVLLRSPIHVDLVEFCLRNPGFHLGIDQLARSLGRSPAAVEDAVAHLAAHKWLERTVTPKGDTVAFRLPPDLSPAEVDSLEPYLALLRSASRLGNEHFNNPDQDHPE